jgi:hypothetical protein
MSIPTFDLDAKDVRSRYNRATDNKQSEEINQETSVGLITVDTAILSFLQDKIKPVVSQDGKQIKVPVIYGNPERWKSAQQDGGIRDKNGKIMLPIMMIRRTNMQKNSLNSPVNKYQSYLFKTKWNSRNVYDRFTALNQIVPSEVYYSATIPDYYDISYEGMIWTEYMEQMNKLVENVSFESDEYWGKDNNYKFITRIKQFDQLTELPVGNDRMVRNKFVINVKAYILPQTMLDKNGNRTKSTRVEYSPKKVSFPTETVTRIE